MNINSTEAKTYKKAFDNDKTITTTPSLQSTYNPPHHRGEVGWICPVCGRGLAPSTSYCPCNVTGNITYLNGGVIIKDVLDNAINCTSTPPEAYYATTTATNTSK